MCGNVLVGLREAPQSRREEEEAAAALSKRLEVFNGGLCNLLKNI